MNDLILIEKPKLPTKWNYNESVEKVKQVIFKWKNLTERLAQELWIAREMLRAQGIRTDLTSEGKFRSWSNYCEEIGSSRQVINNWLARWFLIEKKEIEKIPLPEGKYNVLLADPPWTYKNTGVEGAVDKQYPTLTIEEIEEYTDNEGKKIKELPDDDAVLFLWVTNPILEECFPVIKSWGFDYKTNLCWVKKNKKTGIGFYVRGIHELLLICIRGSMLPLYTPLSIIEEEATRHSKKPKIYDLIERMYPDQKYIELFARKIKKEKRRIGWEYWGAEV